MVSLSIVPITGLIVLVIMFAGMCLCDIHMQDIHDENRLIGIWDNVDDNGECIVITTNHTGYFNSEHASQFNWVKTNAIESNVYYSICFSQSNLTQTMHLDRFSSNMLYYNNSVYLKRGD